MRVWIVIVSIAALVGAACGSSGDAEGPKGNAEKVADALTRAVKFENGRSRSGSIARLDPAASTVSLESATAQLELGPGSAMILPLEVTTAAGDEVAATLLQFEGADSHTEVPAGDNATASDGGAAGAGGATLEIENAFEVDDDVCERLCNEVHTATLQFAIQLAGGAVSAKGRVTIRLDCRDDGDPDLCESSGGGGSGSSDDDGGGVSLADAGGLSGSGGNGQVGSGDGGAQSGSGGSSGDAGVLVDAGSGVPPQVAAIVPETATAGQGLTLTIDGTGFSADATVYVDGVEVETTLISDTMLEATIPGSALDYAGSHLVYVENMPGDASSRSSVLYLQVAPAPGAPIIYDYSPDNGVAGDTILIIASNLMGQTLTIEDEDGTELEPGTIGTIGWPTVGSVDTVEVVLPAGISTGPITIANPIGAYRGKIFSVGQNLTREAGTVVTASSEYNTTNWSKVSGADNNLASSYFTMNGDCATATTCTMVPWFMVSFADPQTVARIAMRGNREYDSGYDFIRGTFEVLDSNEDLLWEGTYDLPAPDRDIDVVLPSAVSGASAVRFTSLEDESTEPGFAELEVFAE